MRLHPCRDGIYSSFWPKEIVIPTKIHLAVVSGIVFSGMMIRIFLPYSAPYLGATFAVIDPIVRLIQAFFILPCVFYLKAFKDEGKWHRIDKICCYSLIFIAGIAILSTVLTYYDNNSSI
jgi:Na+/phosphate symporter